MKNLWIKGHKIDESYYTEPAEMILSLSIINIAKKNLNKPEKFCRLNLHLFLLNERGRIMNEPDIIS